MFGPRKIVSVFTAFHNTHSLARSFSIAHTLIHGRSVGSYFRTIAYESDFHCFAQWIFPVVVDSFDRKTYLEFGCKMRMWLARDAVNKFSFRLTISLWPINNNTTEIHARRPKKEKKNRNKRLNGFKCCRFFLPFLLLSACVWLLFFVFCCVVLWSICFYARREFVVFDFWCKTFSLFFEPSDFWSWFLFVVCHSRQNRIVFHWLRWSTKLMFRLRCLILKIKTRLFSHSAERT